MTALAFVAVAAACTLLRALVTAGQAAGQIPWRTFGLNVGGAFVLGVISATGWFGNPVIAAAAGLGSLTTFSTVAAETASLLHDGQKRPAMAYLGVTLVAGIAAAWLGLTIGDSL